MQPGGGHAQLPKALPVAAGGAGRAGSMGYPAREQPVSPTPACDMLARRIALVAWANPKNWSSVMRMLMHVHFPLEPFNTAVRDGSAGSKIKRILEANKPEAAYFCEHNGQRGGTLVVNVNDTSEIPVLAKPWFLTFN